MKPVPIYTVPECHFQVMHGRKNERAKYDALISDLKIVVVSRKDDHFFTDDQKAHNEAVAALRALASRKL